jgi:hypothetical protein
MTLREPDALRLMVQVQLLPLQAVCYFFLGVAFFSGFAAGLPAQHPVLLVLQVTPISLTSLLVIYQNYIS